jgi:7-cyano-7-deazaguanine synthase
MNYGQLHRKEIECAQWQAAHYGATWKKLAIGNVFEDIASPLLGSGEIPDKSYAEQLDEKEGRVTTYVPNRNMILLSIAAAHAMSLGISTVSYAAHMDDAERGAYPDCTPEFLARMSAVLRTQAIELYAPFLGRLTADSEIPRKADVVRLGIELGVDFSHTWSCYKGGEKPCGVCGTCRDRIAAFKANGMEDPLVYG